MSSTHITLGAAADERKARLAKLRSLKRKQPDDDGEAPEPATDDAKPSLDTTPDVAKLVLSGRNYDAETKGPKLGFEAPPTLALETSTIEQQAADVAEETRRKAEEDAQDETGVDLFKLQPKKPNWDLKRDLGKKLEGLNVRTENAIASLVRERIANSQKTEELKGNMEVDGQQGIGVDGIALVEGVRVREREEQEEERRAKDDEEMQ